jgi:hypothetical protein
MNSTPDPKGTEPREALTGDTDERLAHAHDEIKRADEQLTRLTEQLAKMERDDAHPPSAGSGVQGPGATGPSEQEPGAQAPGRQGVGQGEAGPQPPPRGRPALPTLVGLSLAASIIVAALLALLLSYGDGPTLIVARWAPQPVSTPENPPSPAQAAPSTFQVAAAESTPAQAPPPQATTLAQAAPQDAAPAAPGAPPDQMQLLQTIARDLANLERTIEQLKANQQQVANDNSKAIGELKATQEEMKRALAKVSEPGPPKTSSEQGPPKTAQPPSPPPTQPARALRKPERTVERPQVRTRPRFRREWIYDDDW